MRKNTNDQALELIKLIIYMTIQQKLGTTLIIKKPPLIKVIKKFAWSSSDKSWEAKFLKLR